DRRDHLGRKHSTPSYSPILPTSHPAHTTTHITLNHITHPQPPHTPAHVRPLPQRHERPPRKAPARSAARARGRGGGGRAYVWRRRLARVGRNRLTVVRSKQRRPPRPRRRLRNPRAGIR
ncbi:hypothetical protein K523DRAFT_422373, partial [Schizophyllum commune Tattone D]